MTDTERERLISLIDQTNNRWQHGVGSGGYDINKYMMLGIPMDALADAILASDWLAEHTRRAQAQALREAASERPFLHMDEWVADALLARADQIEQVNSDV